MTPTFKKIALSVLRKNLSTVVKINRGIFYVSPLLERTRKVSELLKELVLLSKKHYEVPEPPPEVKPHTPYRLLYGFAIQNRKLRASSAFRAHDRDGP